MKFSLRWLFLITTYAAVLMAGFVIGQSWPPALWLSILVVIFISHIKRWRGIESPEAKAYRDRIERERGPMEWGK